MPSMLRCMAAINFSFKQLVYNAEVTDRNHRNHRALRPVSKGSSLNQMFFQTLGL